MIDRTACAQARVEGNRAMRRRWVLVGCFACVAAACGGHTVDLGSSGDGGASSGDGSSGGGSSGGSSGSSSGSTGSNPLSGTYKGYLESFMFPDGSDTVVMTLTFAAAGTVTGTIFFGDGPPLAPPTDPSVGYPPGFRDQGSTLPASALLEGFDFTILDGTYTAPRLQLGFDPGQLWTKWCELQTSYPYCNCPNGSDGGCPSGSSYACLPNSATGQSGFTCNYTPCGDSMPMPIDCGRLALCDMQVVACTCTATGCTVPVPAVGGITFDMQLNAGALDGSETGISSSVLNVHLTKQP